MKIAILGHGVEGRSAEQYFKKQGNEVTVFDNFNFRDLPKFQLHQFDLIMRSPSLSPANIQAAYPETLPLSSITKYFFEHCPAPIIGVTGTKGKGTTASIIQAILKALGTKTWLVGNIGTPALDILGQIQPSDTVIYELSSFQLWDLHQSPQVAVVLRIEPDHLDKHTSFDDYLQAKANIAKFQTATDTCIFYQNNSDSRKIAQLSAGTKLPYPTDNAAVLELASSINLRGAHNQENAAAAIIAVAAAKKLALDTFLTKYHNEISTALKNFHGLPHRLELVRTLNHVEYYDDNYSSAFPALDVAVAAFHNRPTFLIAGGQDRQLDLSVTQNRLATAPNLQKIFLIGETAHQLAKKQDSQKFIPVTSLTAAVQQAQITAEKLPPQSLPVVLMSPGAASFDMFQNFSDRGNQFQKIVQELS